MEYDQVPSAHSIERYEKYMSSDKSPLLVLYMEDKGPRELNRYYYFLLQPFLAKSYFMAGALADMNSTRSYFFTRASTNRDRICARFSEITSCES